LIRKLAGGGRTVKGEVDAEGGEVDAEDVVRISRHGLVIARRPDRRDLFQRELTLG